MSASLPDERQHLLQDAVAAALGSARPRGSSGRDQKSRAARTNSVGTRSSDASHSCRPDAREKLSSSAPLGERKLGGVREPLVGSLASAAAW